ncbi:hypothetical protein [Desulfobacca acetoxidans]|nr:hypothetical protein [Desulfobacterales bacterium]
MARKRNKRTRVVSKLELSSLTEHILATMGEEGRCIRERLIRFLQEKTVPDQKNFNKTPQTKAAEIASN